MGEPEPAAPGVDEQARRQRLAHGGQARGRRQVEEPRDDGQLELLREQRRRPTAAAGWAGRACAPAREISDATSAAPARSPAARSRPRARGGTAGCRCWPRPRPVADLAPRRARAPPRPAGASRDGGPVESARTVSRSTSAPAEQVGARPLPARTGLAAAPRRAADHPATGRIAQQRRNASSDGSSAHWTSSTTSRQPRRRPRTSRSAPNRANRSSAWIGDRTSGTSWRHTQNGGAPSSAPWAQRTRAGAASAAARTRLVLPMPASPSTTTSRGCPSPAGARSGPSRASSPSRP